MEAHALTARMIQKCVRDRYLDFPDSHFGNFNPSKPCSGPLKVRARVVSGAYIIKSKIDFISSPVQKYRKSYCTTSGFGISIGIGIGIGGVDTNKNVKVLHQSF